MILHIFNPEHDIALSYDNKYFTPPHAGRQLRYDLDYLPALWAKDGDCIMVGNTTSAMVHARRFMAHVQRVRFISQDEVANVADEIESVSPWGWDSAIKFQLMKLGIHEDILPSDAELSEIRTLSNRRFSAHVLQQLQQDMQLPFLCGEAFYVESIPALKEVIQSFGKVIIKAPWSSSGRGVRYIEQAMDAAITSWAARVISQQGGIMVEPYYNKMKDFGMEFFVDAAGVHYAGLSVFHTINGAYVGNSLSTEDEKRQMLAPYVDNTVLDRLAEHLTQLLNDHLKGKYQGPLGVDMMVVANQNTAADTPSGFFVHPVVEINLRRTMGHVALSLSKEERFQQRMMRVDYDGAHYHLHTIHKEQRF